MDVLRLPVLYFRQFCFYLAEQVNALFDRAGIDVEIFSIDVALIIGVIVGFVLHTFFLPNENTLHQSPARQPVTIDGKTKEEVREKAKRQL